MSRLFIIAIAFMLMATSGCANEPSTPASVQKMRVGSIEMAYYTRGSGKPLLMIIGFRRTMADWDPALLEALENQYTLILFDHRGVGLSTDTEKDLTTISQMADDAAGLTKALGYQKTYVLGWSMGGRVAQQLALRHPERVEKLILCGTNPGGAHQVRKEAETAEKHAFLFPSSPEGRAAFQESQQRIERAVADGTAPSDLEVSPRTVERQTRAVRLWRMRDENYQGLSQIKIPTLVAGGLEDVLDPPENSRLLAARIPFAWAAYFAGAGHAFLFQDYQRFAELVTLFLNSSN